MRTCDFDGCGQKHKAHGLCNGHYKQFRKRQELSPLEARSRKSENILMMGLPARFWAKVMVQPQDHDGCWEWMGAKDSPGYGRFRIDNKLESSHVLTYEVFKGLVPPGLELDHLCRKRACCNPEHLEAVTRKENVLRGSGNGGALYEPKKQCLRGHVYNEAGYYIHSNKIVCKVCRKKRAKESRAKKRAEKKGH